MFLMFDSVMKMKMTSNLKLREYDQIDVSSIYNNISVYETKEDELEA